MTIPQAKTFAIAQISIHDDEMYNEYISADHVGIWDEYGGTLNVIDDHADVLEGSWPLTRTVIVEFPSRAQAQAWYDSDDYQAVIGLRHGSASSNVVIVSGLLTAGDDSNDG